MKTSLKLIRKIFLLLSPLLLGSTMQQCDILTNFIILLCLATGGEEVRINDRGETEVLTEQIFVANEGAVWFTDVGAGKIGN